MKNLKTYLLILLAALSMIACQEDDPITSCSDGMQNGTETGVDCGGDCAACEVLGCTDTSAHNYNPLADTDDGSCETCDDGVQNGDEDDVDCGGALCEPCFGVGLIGEAGGVIFYDKGAYTDGWRYLEAAPEDYDGCLGSIQYPNPLETDNNIGFGKSNTEILVTNDPGGSSIFAAADNFSVNGKSDWFVPSRDELIEIYENRSIIPNLHTTSGECHDYWCSTLEELYNGNWLPKVMSPINGDFGFPNPSTTTRFVRRF